MKAKTISIYVRGKLVLRASNLEYDEETGKSTKLFPPSAVFKGKVSQVLVADSNGAVTKAADHGQNDLEIIAEVF